MNKTIATIALFLATSAAFAQSGHGVSATAVADEDVSARTVATDAKDNRRPAPSLSDCCGVPVSAPYIAASVATSDCCGVPVSAPQYAKQEEDDSGSMAMAGLGFGLVSLVGVSKLARRKKAIKEPNI